MGARETFLDLTARGFRLAVQNGRLVVTPASSLTDDDRDAIRRHRDELMALLGQGPELDSGPCRAEGPSAAPGPAQGAADLGAPSDWQTADRSYQRHHWACPTCASAGLGYGDRCPEGARLWAAYTAQPGPAGRKPERQQQATPAEPQRHPYETERRAWTPASDAEIARMAATFERAVALGLTPDEADHVADVMHWSYRLGDLRPCLACAHLRSGTTSRWWCSAQRQPLPQQLVVQPHRCGLFIDTETKGGCADGV